MRLINLGRGLVTRVDNDVYELVSKYDWHSAYCKTENDIYYHVRTRINGKSVILHRLITNCPDGMVVDHKNGDSLDNQRHNLRICTQSQNMANRRKTENKPVVSNNYKGITYYQQPRCLKNGDSKKWKARLGFQGKRLNLGWFKIPEEAAIAYDKAATKYFGEFASLNFKEK